MWKIIATTFLTVFLAELGDKTQLATLGLSAGSGSRLAVFVGSATALVATSLIAVLAGGLVARYVPPHYLQRGAAILFVILGVWTFYTSYRGV
jgi:Ca2+/H+ antiporter, TMEM165/GDT1 family